MSNREQRQLTRDVAYAHVPGKLAAARIDAAAFAAHTALHHVAMLTSIESQLLEQVPLGEGRYKAVVDAFAGFAAGEIVRLGME